MNRRGQVAVVLGAGGGLGQGIARMLAREGCGVLAADIDTAAVQSLVAGTSDGSVLADSVDITDAEDVERIAARAEQHFGRIDIVCNCVGVLVAGTAWEIAYPDWRWQLDVNVLGQVHVVQTFIPRLITQGTGHFVATASTVALTAVPGVGAYAASKHAVLGMSEALQQDLRACDSAVRVSVLLPGAIRSRMYEGKRNRHDRYGGADASGRENVAERESLDRFGADPDVLAEVLWHQLDAGAFYAFGRRDDVELSDARARGIASARLDDPTFQRRPGPGARGAVTP